MLTTVDHQAACHCKYPGTQDAGGNAGFSTMLFAGLWPSASVIVVEPDEANLKVRSPLFSCRSCDLRNIYTRVTDLLIAHQSVQCHSTLLYMSTSSCGMYKHVDTCVRMWSTLL